MYPPYSPDLAPSDYHLFRSLKNSLNGVKLASKEACENHLVQYKPGDARIPVQFVPLRAVLKEIIELPQMFQHIMSHVQMVENEKHEISNVMQTKYWQDKKARLSGNEFLLPLALYQDEVETNNALGSHRGRGKVSAVYVVLPFLPHPSRLGTLEN